MKHSECLCDGSSCRSGDRCFGQQCFTSLSMQNGTSILRKGCIVGNEGGTLSCENPPTPERMIECCSGDLCNMNVSLKSLVKGECVSICYQGHSEVFLPYRAEEEERSLPSYYLMFGNVFVVDLLQKAVLV